MCFRDDDEDAADDADVAADAVNAVDAYADGIAKAVDVDAHAEADTLPLRVSEVESPTDGDETGVTVSVTDTELE